MNNKHDEVEMSEIKRWLVKGPGSYCRFYNTDFLSMSIVEIVCDSNRPSSELLITRSSSFKGTTGTFYHWLEDDLHETLKGKYTLGWKPRHGKFELIVRASEDFMVEWKLIHGADMEIEEIVYTPKRHRLVLYDYDLLDDVPEDCNNLSYEDKVDWHNQLWHRLSTMPQFGKNDAIVHNWTLQRPDSDFLKDDKHFIHRDIINGLTETILEVFVTDSRFAEITNHFPTASEIVRGEVRCLK